MLETCIGEGSRGRERVTVAWNLLLLHFSQPFTSPPIHSIPIQAHTLLHCPPFIHHFLPSFPTPFLHLLLLTTRQQRGREMQTRGKMEGRKGKSKRGEWKWLWIDCISTNVAEYEPFWLETWKQEVYREVTRVGQSWGESFYPLTRHVTFVGLCPAGVNSPRIVFFNLVRKASSYIISRTHF